MLFFIFVQGGTPAYEEHTTFETILKKLCTDKSLSPKKIDGGKDVLEAFPDVFVCWCDITTTRSHYVFPKEAFDYKVAIDLDECFGDEIDGKYFIAEAEAMAR